LSGREQETWCDEDELRSSEERDKGTEVIKGRVGCESMPAKETTVSYLNHHGMCSAGSEATDQSHLSRHTNQVERSSEVGSIRVALSAAFHDYGYDTSHRILKAPDARQRGWPGSYYFIDRCFDRSSRMRHRLQSNHRKAQGTKSY